MIRTFIQSGDGRTEDLTHHETMVGAEAAYWRAVATRRDGPAAFVLDPGRGTDLVLQAARFRMDRTWRGPREQDAGRHLALWALPLERGGARWPGVEPHTIRGLIEASGWSQLHAARVLGVADTTVRGWLSAKKPTRIEYPTWVLLRDLALEAVRERACEVGGTHG